MFGLMKPRSCSNGENDLHRRLNYCGTCKTMGNLYGQKSRFLLNHDTVFLSELLTVVSGKAEDSSYWGKAYHSYNCFSIPKNNEEMPIELQVAATATVVLTSYKLADHVIDSGRSIWLLGQKLFSKSFRDASKRLKEWDFPLQEMDGYLLSQSKRESESVNLSNLKSSKEILDYLAEPTAKATALFFEHGTKLIGKESQQELMHQIGASFGAIAYLIDAYEDYKKDLKKKEFNALKVAFNSGETLSFQEKANTKEIIWQLASEIEELLPKLELEAKWVKYFSQRLKDNLSIKLTGKLPLLNKTCNKTCDVSERMSLSRRGNTALTTARALTVNYQSSKQFILAKLFSPLVFLSTLLVAFLLPKKAVTAKSYQDCLILGLNLISLQSIVKNLIPLLSPSRLIPNVGLFRKNRKSRKCKPLACCDCCDCCTCCDILCDAIDCFECGCEVCDSCGSSGSCDCCGDCGSCGDCCSCDCNCDCC